MEEFIVHNFSERSPKLEKGVCVMFECKFIRKTSKKGNEYCALEITFPNGYKKLVFLDGAEKYLAEQSVECF